MQEVAECNAQAELFEVEMQGGVVVEVALFLYTIVVMHVLIEEWYVPALELVTSPDVLGALTKMGLARRIVKHDASADRLQLYNSLSKQALIARQP